MSRTTSRIPVDVFNPGQVFACYGLIELGELLCGNVRAGFVDDEFVIEANGDNEPVKVALDFIAASRTSALLPKTIRAEAQPWEWVWKKPDFEEVSTDEYPSCAPGAPAKLVARLRSADRFVDVEHWAEEPRTARDNVKFWAGSRGMPGIVMLDSAIDLVRTDIARAYLDPLNFQRPQSSSFRFDWRAGYVPMDIGWSLNKHDDVKMGGYPLVDVLAAIGLTNARPNFIKKVLYRYSVLLGAGHRPAILRAALGGAPQGFLHREFEMQLGWPGKEGQARAIVGVTEVKKKESA